MISYKLAEQLKDAGFPQRKGVPKYATDYIGMFVPSVGDVTIPTLSELIEACGVNFRELMHHQDGSWVAKYWYNYPQADGKTPEEAVAKLWLALNSKDA